MANPALMKDGLKTPLFSSSELIHLRDGPLFFEEGGGGEPISKKCPHTKKKQKKNRKRVSKEKK